MSLSRPKIPHYKAEMEINLIKQGQDETIDAYLIRKLRAIRHDLPEATEEEKIHSSA